MKIKNTITSLLLIVAASCQPAQALTITEFSKLPVAVDYSGYGYANLGEIGVATLMKSRTVKEGLEAELELGEHCSAMKHYDSMKLAMLTKGDSVIMGCYVWFETQSKGWAVFNGRMFRLTKTNIIKEPV